MFQAQSCVHKGKRWRPERTTDFLPRTLLDCQNRKKSCPYLSLLNVLGSDIHGYFSMADRSPCPTSAHGILSQNPSQLWDPGRHQMTPGGIKTNPFWYNSSKSFSRTMGTVPESHGTQKARYGSKARAPGSFWETKELGVSSSTFLSWVNPRRWIPTVKVQRFKVLRSRDLESQWKGFPAFVPVEISALLSPCSKADFLLSQPFFLLASLFPSLHGIRGHCACPMCHYQERHEQPTCLETASSWKISLHRSPLRTGACPEGMVWTSQKGLDR